MKVSNVELTLRIIGCLIATFLILSGITSFINPTPVNGHDAQYWVCLILLTILLAAVWIALIIDKEKE